MYTAAVRCYHICISGFFPRFGSGYLTHNCAVAHNFHFCERLDRRPAESIQRVGPADNGRVPAFRSRCHCQVLHLTRSAVGHHRIRHIQAGKLHLANRHPAGGRTRDRVDRGNECLLYFNCTRGVEHTHGRRPVQHTMFVVEFHRLETLRIKSRVAYHCRSACRFVDLAEITHETDRIQLTSQVGREREIFLIKRGHFGGSPRGRVYLHQSRGIIVSLGYGIHSIGRQVIRHVVDKCRISRQCPDFLV